MDKEVRDGGHTKKCYEPSLHLIGNFFYFTNDHIEFMLEYCFSLQQDALLAWLRFLFTAVSFQPPLSF